jgi:quercetin dioxygenase-like cupin family protein
VEYERAKTFKITKEEEWESQPLVKDILLNLVIGKADNDAGVTCYFVRIPEGQEIPLHFHESSNDIIVPLSGKVKIWVKGIGEFGMVKGPVVNVPKGIPHRVFDVTEDFLAFDIFSPGIK